MKLLKQGAYTSNIRRYGDHHAIADACLLSTDFEGSVSVIFERATMKITEARWAIHRAADPESRGQGFAPMLVGDSAHANEKNCVKYLPDYSRSVDFSLPPGGWDGEVQSHKRVLTPATEDREEAKAHRDEVSPAWKVIRELYLEVLRGVLQAEYYMLPERGYTSYIDYELKWGDSMIGNCRPYDGEKPPIDAWAIYVGGPNHYRGYDYYNKYKQFTLIDREDGTVSATGAYHDSFHELTVTLDFQKEDGIITDYEQVTVRVPFDACRELDHLHREQFIGKDIRGFAKRDVGKISGGSSGCYHLVDIVADISDAAKDI